jgi:hypothetical protein
VRKRTFGLFLILLVPGLTLGALTVHSAVCNGVTPRGALPPAIEEWCFTPLAAPNDTHVEAVNAWVDDFDNGGQHAQLGQPGDVYVTGRINTPDAIFFRHNNHWMVDQQGPTGEGHVWMRPARTFTKQADGSFVVEFEVADAAYGGDEFDSRVWPEITVSTLGTPTSNGLYTYNAFNGGNNFGCRLQRYGFPICEFNIGGGRVFEASHFQTGHAATSFGGGPWPGVGLSGVWKYCETTEDPDSVCRNKFRLTLTATSFRLDVNGVRYFEQTGVPSMAALLDQPMYTYMSQSLWAAPSSVYRSHWDHFAVNPSLIGDVGTPTPTPTPTVTATATPSPTVTPTPEPTGDCILQWNGETLDTRTLTRAQCDALIN